MQLPQPLHPRLLIPAEEWDGKGVEGGGGEREGEGRGGEGRKGLRGREERVKGKGENIGKGEEVKGGRERGEEKRRKN